MPDDPPLRCAFLMEQTLGHAAHSANLRAAITSQGGIGADWLPVPYTAADLAGHIPILRNNWSITGSLRAASLLRRHIKLSGHLPDRLFVHTQTIAYFTASWMRSIPTIVSLDATPANIDSLGTGYSHRAGAAAWESFKRGCAARVFNAAARLICWSGWAADSLASDYGIKPEKLVVVPPGVDIQFWRRSQTIRDTQRPLRLLFVGADFIRKGGLTLLEAVRLLPQGAYHLDVVTREGFPPGQRGQPGITVHEGMQANSEPLRSLYHQSDIFVLPTSADCLPIAIIEAMASGLPVISTRVGAIPEAVQDNGLLTPPNNPAMLAEAIEQLSCAEKRLQCGIAGASLAADRYDAGRNAGTILAMISMPDEQACSG